MLITDNFKNTKTGSSYSKDIGVGVLKLLCNPCKLRYQETHYAKDRSFGTRLRQRGIYY